MRHYKKDLLCGVEITKKNIGLYYKFMSNEDLIKNEKIINPILNDRQNVIWDILENDSFSIDILLKFVIVKNGTGHKNISQTILGVKDTLQPLNKYISEIKNSLVYKEYITSIA